jgi:2-polyprenyl-3-methyl-5-hydroxy-6-metoxy-1,4-benzoquinol methylase
MVDTARNDVWAQGAAYERYVGRWSRRVADEFLIWLAIPPGQSWLDVGCGTGALTQRILEQAAPAWATHGHSRSRIALSMLLCPVWC